ncbi:MAG TPA: peptidoglycan-binding protein [Solirubrobacteraceae bacterium]|jgi:cell wall-associated NlpC family hydrolase|nr:peptidoglycan-binding protein [Solirubrobacteraceae bacterium]
MASAYSLGSRTLSKGMEGRDVKTLQRDLTAVRIKTFVSGVFSEGTKIHVKYFQRRAHLAMDGVVGPRTARVLKKDAKRRLAEAADSSGGEGTGPSASSAPAGKATLNSKGLAVAPSGAPAVIENVIAAANKIAFKPYVYGGGHASWDSTGYDCSGSVSYALHGGGLLSTPYDSTQFESYGASGYGKWITIYANSSHAYMKVAGLWYDTAAQSSHNGDRWSTTRVSPSTGFIVRHPRNW